jgi:hypothetical protein
MNFKFKWLAVVIILSLSACSDNVPTTIPLNTKDTLPLFNQAAKLHLDVLSSPENSTTVEMILGEGIELLATLENQTGESLPNQSLVISSSKGNFLTENNLLTDHDGQATSLLLATVIGADIITVVTPTGLTAQLTVVVSTPNELNDDISEEKLPDVTLNFSESRLLHF